MKYIDADKLIAEIARRKKQDVTFRERSLLIDMETAITSLQQEQPEVDLEKEIKRYFNGWQEDEEYGGAVRPDCYSATLDDCKNIARHFYELWLNARKEETK